MNDIKIHFIRIKEELLTTSKLLLEYHGVDDQFKSSTYGQHVLEIQSKISTMASLAVTKPEELSRFKESADHLMQQANEADSVRDDDPVNYAYERGVLAGMTYSYLNEVNSVEFDFDNEKFRLDLDSLR